MVLEIKINMCRKLNLKKIYHHLCIDVSQGFNFPGNCIDGVIVKMLAFRVVDRGFKPDHARLQSG